MAEKKWGADLCAPLDFGKNDHTPSRLTCPFLDGGPVKIFVRRYREEVVLATKLLIMPAAPRRVTLWPFLMMPPFAVSLFALHQKLRRSRML